jgi:Methyltransferase domain
LVVCATVEEARFHPESFGAVGAFDVIEHIERPEGFCDEIASILSRDGMLYATVPAGQWLWSSADRDAGHYRRYSEASLRRLLEPRFDVVYLTFFFRPLLLPLFLFRALPYRLGLARNRPILSTAVEHASAQGLLSRVLQQLLASEVERIRDGCAARIGASCLVAARKRRASRLWETSLPIPLHIGVCGA